MVNRTIRCASMVMGAFLLVGIGAASVQAQDGQVSVDECGGFPLPFSGEFSCQPAVGINVDCTKLNFEASCEVQVVADIRADANFMCDASVNVEVTAECKAECDVRAKADANFSCSADCQAQAKLDCSASCSASAGTDQAAKSECESKCESNAAIDCSASCKASANASVEAQCEASCKGEATAKANFQCVADFEANASVDIDAQCKTELEADCNAGVDFGIVCDDLYFSLENINITQCLAASATASAQASASGEVSLGGDCSVSSFANPMHASAVLGGFPGLVFLFGRRRRK